MLSSEDISLLTGYQAERQAKLDAIALAMLMLDVDRLNEPDMRYVLNKVGFTGMFVTNEVLAHDISWAISRWPTPEETTRVRNTISQSTFKLRELIVEACKQLKKG